MRKLSREVSAGTTRTMDKVRAGAWATLWTGVLVAAIVLGSRNLQNFDPALVIYTFAIVFATWASSITTASGFASLPPRVLATGMAAFQTTRGAAQFAECCNIGGDCTFLPRISFAAARGCAGRCTN